MFLYQIHGCRYSPKSLELGATITVKDAETSVSISMTPEEEAELEALGQRVFRRYQMDLVAKVSAPLETPLLAPPSSPIEDADFEDVGF